MPRLSNITNINMSRARKLQSLLISGSSMSKSKSNSKSSTEEAHTPSSWTAEIAARHRFHPTDIVPYLEDPGGKKKSHAVYRCFPHLIALLDLHWPQQTWATTDIGWLDDTGYFNQHFRFMNPQVLGIAQPLVTIGGSSKPMTMQPTSSYAPGITRTKFSWSIPPPCLAQTCWVLLVGFNSCLQQLDELDYTKCYAENCHFRRKWARTIGLSKELQRLPQLGSGSPSLDWTNRKEACLPSLALSPSLFYTIISLPQGSSAWTIHGKLGNWTH